MSAMRCIVGVSTLSVLAGLEFVARALFVAALFIGDKTDRYSEKVERWVNQEAAP